MKILITSALPYVNNIPHLGNIMGCVLPADVLARYYKAQNNEVLYICGADEYGSTTEMKAKELNITPRELCDNYIKLHKKIYKWFGIEFDHFGRTSTQNPKTDTWNHTKITQDIFKRLAVNGFLFEKKMTQFYCLEIGEFISGRFISGNCPNCNNKIIGEECSKCNSYFDMHEIINPCYTLNKNYTLIKKDSEHIFLDLEKLKPKLQTWYNGVKNNWSPVARQITKKWLKNLKSRCITRDLEWGTPVPDTELFGSKYRNKVFYNWFDAPIGYISITSNHTQDNWWKDTTEPVKIIQTQAKDNVPFHSIMFPATLIGADDNYNLVTNLYASHYLMYYGVKFSKSEDIGLFGSDVMEMGIDPDIWRFYLMRTRPGKFDSNYTYADFKEKVNFELINTFGNFANRVINFAAKNGIPPFPGHDDFIDEVNELVEGYHHNMRHGFLKWGIRNIIGIAKICNIKLTQEEPWKNKESGIIHVLVHILHLLACMIEPFMPATAKKLYKATSDRYVTSLEFNYIKKVNMIDVLFKYV